MSSYFESKGFCWLCFVDGWSCSLWHLDFFWLRERNRPKNNRTAGWAQKTRYIESKEIAASSTTSIGGQNVSDILQVIFLHVTWWTYNTSDLKVMEFLARKRCTRVKLRASFCWHVLLWSVWRFDCFHHQITGGWTGSVWHHTVGPGQLAFLGCICDTYICPYDIPAQDLSAAKTQTFWFDLNRKISYLQVRLGFFFAAWSNSIPQLDFSTKPLGFSCDKIHVLIACMPGSHGLHGHCWGNCNGKTGNFSEILLAHIQPGSKLLISGKLIPPLLGNPCNGYINPL